MNACSFFQLSEAEVAAYRKRAKVLQLFKSEGEAKPPTIIAQLNWALLKQEPSQMAECEVKTEGYCNNHDEKLAYPGCKYKQLF